MSRRHLSSTSLNYFLLEADDVLIQDVAALLLM